MRKLLLATVFSLAAMASVGTAQADFVFTEGNNPGAVEENILFGAKYTNVQSLTGFTNQTGAPVTFSSLTGSNQLIGTNGIGQADIICTANCNTFSTGGANGAQLTNLEIKVGAGFGATDFIGNLDFGEGTANIVVVDQFGASFQYILSQGQNFFTLNAINGEVIKDIQISSYTAGQNFGFNLFKQPRISGICTLQGDTCTPVAEPASLAVLGVGLAALGIVTRRRQRRGAAAA
jgi:hypothetical protein